MGVRAQGFKPDLRADFCAFTLLIGLLLSVLVPLTGCSRSDGLGLFPVVSEPGMPIYQGSCRGYQVIRHPGHVVGYSPCHRNPLWVSYRVSRDLRHALPPRPEKFHADPAAPEVRWHAFKGSGYQRGHLAPRYAIARLYGEVAQEATFYMTNITPQRPNLNQKAWQRLEEVEIDEMSRWHGALQVIVGPIFDAQQEILPSGVEVPDAFFRIWLDGDTWNGRPRVLAFIVPQDVRGDEPLDGFLASVDEIERQTGLDFFAALDDAVEDPLEAQVEAGPWKLARVARQPPRY